MVALAWIGGGMSVLGLLGVLWCIRKAAWLRKAELDDETSRAEINRLIFAHIAAMGIAFLGLGLMTVGFLLA